MTTKNLTVLTKHAFTIDFKVYGIHAYTNDMFYSITGYGCSVEKMPGRLDTSIKSPLIIAPSVVSDLIYTIEVSLPKLPDIFTIKVMVHVQPPPVIALNPFSITTFSYETHPTIADDCHDLEQAMVSHLPCTLSLQFTTPAHYTHKDFQFTSIFVITYTTRCCGKHHLYILKSLGNMSSDLGFVCSNCVIVPEGLSSSPHMDYAVFLHLDKDKTSDSIIQLITSAHLQQSLSDNRMYVIDKNTQLDAVDAPLLTITPSTPRAYFVTIPPLGLQQETSTTCTITVTHQCMHNSDVPLSLEDPWPVTINVNFDLTSY